MHPVIVSKDFREKYNTRRERIVNAAHIAALACVVVAETCLLGSALDLAVATVAYGMHWQHKYKATVRIPSGTQLTPENLRRTDQFRRLTGITHLLTCQSGLQYEPTILYHGERAGPNNIGIYGSPPILVVYKPIADILMPWELFAIVAHEVSHVAANHRRLVTVGRALSHLAVLQGGINLALNALVYSANLAQMALSSVVVTATVAAVSIIRASFYLHYECQADRGSFLLCQEPQAIISGIEKVSRYHLNSPRVHSIGRLLCAVDKQILPFMVRLRTKNIHRTARRHKISLGQVVSSQLYNTSGPMR